MNMNIIDPIDGQNYSLTSVQGKHILKQYIKFYQKGGHFVEVSQQMLCNTESFGPDCCVANAFNWMGYGIFKNIFQFFLFRGGNDIKFFFFIINN